MAVTTQLTWMQEKSLQNCLGGKQFSLLYKASVHGFLDQYLLQRCSNQGPTITVIYSEKYIIGAYVKDSYEKRNKGSVIFFAFERTQNSEFEIRLFKTCTNGQSTVRDCKNTLYYGNDDLYLYIYAQYIEMKHSTTKKIGLPPGHISFQECEVFRCEDLLNERKINMVTALRESLLSDVRTYNPRGGLIHQIRILLLGPIGAGKSSFINSVKSVFRGHVTNQSVMGFDTKQFRTYSIKDGKDGNPLPFTLCDSMGLGEKQQGLCMQDIVYILKGHIPDRYQISGNETEMPKPASWLEERSSIHAQCQPPFHTDQHLVLQPVHWAAAPPRALPEGTTLNQNFNSVKPITPSHLNYIDSPLLKDRIHCVAFVLNANTVGNLSYEMVANIKRIRREVIKCGVVQVALLTHVEDLHLITKADLIDPYKCMPVKFKVEAVHREFGFPLSDILVVSNYTSEWELCLMKDVLILSSLKQMLWAADDFLEDLPPEGTDGILKRPTSVIPNV
ncbi:interferon-induced protein 44 isoform X1 [Loxodonta africana]|uniref:interferon-induced protein 44 isoform X1 n=1 Tax=Loxodonta africana TaxID=9785 RepID=UPI000C8132AB|nr:interferon-induced protein 44 isoform X1 [Loxodonta africana]